MTDHTRIAADVAGNTDLEFAVSIALTAGAFLADRPTALVLATKSSDVDVVTHMDQASEQMIVDALTTHRPLDGVIGEEGAARDSDSGRTWVIDPIDGTTNYLYGLPHWCVSIGMVDSDSGQGVVGVVFAPALNLLYYGVRGRGSWLSSAAGLTQLRCSRVDSLATSLVATGFGYVAQRRASQARVLTSLLPQVRDIRRLGSCALDLCQVAQGTVDAYFERGVNWWDYAAGDVIASEAGAVISGLRSAQPDNDMLIAASPVIHSSLRAVLQRANADSDAQSE